MSTLLEVQGLGITFGGLRAVNDVSFLVSPGEIVSVIGPEISEFHREDLPPAPEPAEEAKAPETTEEEPVANKDEGDSTGKPSDEDGAPSDEQGNEAEASEPTAAADASEKKQGKKKRK